MKTNRIAKTVNEKVADLDAHLHILRNQLESLRHHDAALKVISAELRTLLCRSSGTDGLLIRLIKELNVDDRIFLQVPGCFNRMHPIAKQLEFAYYPITRGGSDVRPQWEGFHPLSEIVANNDAVLASGRPMTHSDLIKAVAQQTGTAHEDEGTEPALIQLRSVLINNAHVVEEVLKLDSELCLEVGERVLQTAESKLGYHRCAFDPEYGNITLAVRMALNAPPSHDTPIVTFCSHIAGLEIELIVRDSGVSWSLWRFGLPVGNVRHNWPAGAVFPREVAVFLSYCSRTQECRSFMNGSVGSKIALSSVGWIHAPDLCVEDSRQENISKVQVHFVATYKDLFSTDRAQQFTNLPADGFGLWSSSEGQAPSPFPD